MTDELAWERATGQTVDRLITIDPRRTGYAAEPELVRKLYQAAREREAVPLTYGASRAILQAVEPYDTVLILTGAGESPWFPAGETDGPPGAVALAHALSLGVDLRPVIATEDRITDTVSGAAHAVGLADVSFEVLQCRDSALSVVSYPTGRADADATAERFLERYDPSVILAVEKMGPNASGVIRQEVEMEQTAWVEPIITKAASRDIPTIGIGDRGNEIGFGKIADDVADIYSNADRFSNIACRVPTDHLVVSGVSNWGAYGVSAMLALLTETPDALHTPDQESDLLRAQSMAGSMDAITHRPVPTVDGTSEATQRGIIAILNMLVRNRLTRHEADHLEDITK